MKRYLNLSLYMIFFLGILNFFDKNISIILIILLIGYLELEDYRYSFLPLVFTIIYKDYYSIIITIVYLFMILGFIKARKNRLYLLIKFIIALALTIFLLYAFNLFIINTIYYSLIALLFYSIINLSFYIDKKIIVSLNDRYPKLFLLLLYLIVITLTTNNILLIMFFFMMIYLINDYKYNMVFIIIYILLSYFIHSEINYSNIGTLATSFFPLVGIVYFNYHNYITIFYSIYTILVFIAKDNNKVRDLTTNHINHLFKDFKEYLEKINYFNDNELALQNIKKSYLENVQSNYCNKCSLNTVCKKKLDKRYQFLLNSFKGDINYYSCPYYNSFKKDFNLKQTIKNVEYSAIRLLALELEGIYYQGLKINSSYESFINDLRFLGYNVIDLDYFLAVKSLYFSFKLDYKKQVNKELIKKVALKNFKEDICVKHIKESKYNLIYIYKTPKCHIEYSHTILAKDNNIVSGDNYYFKKDYNESFIFALSDGMGSGYNAYSESSNTLEILKNISLSHFSSSTGLKLLEDIFEYRLDYDSYATLDFLTINPSLMKANLYKLGSSVTYLYHNNDLVSYQNRALPLKLDDINSSYEIEIFKGDIIFLLSDGVSDFLSKDEIYSLIDKEISIDILVDRIVNEIKIKNNYNLKDDLSIIIIKVID